MDQTKIDRFSCIKFEFMTHSVSTVTAEDAVQNVLNYQIIIILD